MSARAAYHSPDSEMPTREHKANGFPSPAEDYIHTPLSLDSHLIKHPAATFFVRARGETMNGSGIYDGDLMIVDRSIKPTAGHVVVGVMDGEFVIRRLRRPKSGGQPPAGITDEPEFQVWGVVTHSIHAHPPQP